MAKFKRNLILHLNKYQIRIIYPVLISSLIASVSFLLCLAYIYFPDNYKLFNNYTFSQLKFFIPWILIMTSMLVTYLVFWTYYMSNKLVGPYDRIIRELDEILSGKRKGPIKTRKGDEMFDGILKRINSLIKD